eukprot:1150773-Pelagomonas_calceolata.AAC.7
MQVCAARRGHQLHKIIFSVGSKDVSTHLLIQSQQAHGGPSSLMLSCAFSSSPGKRILLPGSETPSTVTDQAGKGQGQPVHHAPSARQGGFTKARQPLLLLAFIATIIHHEPPAHPGKLHIQGSCCCCLQPTVSSAVRGCNKYSHCGKSTGWQVAMHPRAVP